MASKYHSGRLFSSHYASLSPPTTCFEMARSSSHDSTSSASRYNTTSAYTSAPLSRSNSSSMTHQSTAPAPRSAPMRRTSSSSSASTWSASPYRSCLTTSFEEPSSYLSDDDLLCLNIPVESIPNPERQQRKEMSTEEQIAHLRQLQEDEQREEPRRSSSIHSSKKTVRFEEVRQPRRPSQLKRRSTAVRRGLSNLNGPA